MDWFTKIQRGRPSGAHKEVHMKILHTDKAPKAIGPYSQGVDTGDLVFLSGQIPIVPETGEMREGGVKEQTRQVMENIGEVLKSAGLTYSNVVKTTCFLQDLADFAAFNEVYAEYMTHCPARSCVAVRGIPKGALVEVEVLAKR